MKNYCGYFEDILIVGLSNWTASRYMFSFTGNIYYCNNHNNSFKDKKTKYTVIVCPVGVMLTFS